MPRQVNRPQNEIKPATGIMIVIFFLAYVAYNTGFFNSDRVGIACLGFLLLLKHIVKQFDQAAAMENQQPNLVRNGLNHTYPRYQNNNPPPPPNPQPPARDAFKK